MRDDRNGRKRSDTSTFCSLLNRIIIRPVAVLAVTGFVFGAKAADSSEFSPDRTTVLGDAEALRVIAKEVALRDGPSLSAHRRGTLRLGAEVWASRRATAEDCPLGWLLIGPAAWACDEDRIFDGRREVHGSPSNEPDTLEFVRVGEQGALGYASFQRAEQGLPEAELQPGFYVGIAEKKQLGAEQYLRTTHGIWLLASQVRRLTPSTFEGRVLEGLELDRTLLPHLPIGWIYVDGARGMRDPGLSPIGPTLRRLSEVHIHEHRRGKDKLNWYRTDTGWLSERSLRVPSLAETPVPDAAANGSYIDVNTATQTLVAYRLGVPWFATMVSTGRGPANSGQETPKGEHRIWVKLLSSDMDNLDEQEHLSHDNLLKISSESITTTSNLYAVEAVPWVQYFSEGYGLHATYWHDNFGVPKSHGCVNLSLRDARRLFEVTRPKLGPGWQAALPSSYDPGTIVRVR